MRSTTPPPTCTTWRHQASWRVPSARGLVLGVPGLAVDLDRGQARVAALRRLGREPEPAGLLCPLQPERKGRHGEGGVLVEQRHQGLDVVAEEGVLVAVEQGPVLGVEGGHVGGGHDVVAAQRGPGPLQRAVDRRHRGVEQLGDLRGLEAQDLAQHEHRPLAGREVLEGGDERQPHGLAHRGLLGGVGRRRAPPGRRAPAAPTPTRAAGCRCPGRSGWPGPGRSGRARRLRPSRWSKQTLVAMR